MSNKDEFSIEGFVETLRTRNTLYHTDDKECFAEPIISNAGRIFKVHSDEFKDSVLSVSHEIYGKHLSRNILKETIHQIEHFARLEGKRIKVYVRLARGKKAIFIDLGREDGKCLKISKKGWFIISKPKAKFLRSPGMKALPIPKKGEGLKALRKIVRNVSKDDFILILCWLVAVFRCKGPYPILVLQGEQGSGKSFLMRRIRDLCDPSQSPILAVPKGRRDLMISAVNNLILAYDNISYLPKDMSDAFCSLATGGGLSVRKLYQDSTEMVFNACRPIMFNGIPDFVEKNDLADRVIQINMKRISESERKTEKKLLSEFKKVKPAILADLLDAVSEALKKEGKVKLKEKPRMADFAEWSCAASGALGFTPEEFLKIYKENQRSMSISCYEADLVAVAVNKLIANTGPWDGTATDLLKALEEQNDVNPRSRNWPKNATRLASRLREAAPALRAKGINVNFIRTSKERKISVTFINDDE